MRIEESRIEYGFTQQKVAEYIGVCLRTYKKYELNPRKIPAPIILKLARLYDTSSDYLLGLSDSKH